MLLVRTVAIAAVLSLAGSASAQQRSLSRRADASSKSAVALTPTLWAAEPSALVDVALDVAAGDLAASFAANGLRLDKVADGSRAHGLGLRAGQIIKAVNGVALTGRASWRPAEQAVRGKAWIQIAWADGSIREYHLTDRMREVTRTATKTAELASLTTILRTGAQPAATGGVQLDRALIGAMTKHRELLGYAWGRAASGGVLVLSAGGPLNLLGLESFDVVTEVGGHKATSLRTIHDGLDALLASGTLELGVVRRGRPVRVPLTVTEGTVDADALAAALAPLAPPPKPGSVIDVDDSIRKVGELDYRVTRAAREQLLDNPMVVARGARVVPSVKNGKPNGFKLYAIRPGSVYSKLGLMNGDTIHSINGKSMASPDQALETYQVVKDADKLTVKLTRRGKPVTLTIRVVEKL